MNFLDFSFHSCISTNLFSTRLFRVLRGYGFVVTITRGSAAILAPPSTSHFSLLIDRRLTHFSDIFAVSLQHNAMLPHQIARSPHLRRPGFSCPGYRLRRSDVWHLDVSLLRDPAICSLQDRRKGGVCASVVDVRDCIRPFWGRMVSVQNHGSWKRVIACGVGASDKSDLDAYPVGLLYSLVGQAARIFCWQCNLLCA